MDQEPLVSEGDPRSVLAAAKKTNTAIEGWETAPVSARRNPSDLAGFIPNLQEGGCCRHRR